jgi:WhiB family redox-sensing transcriptional regulator
MSARAPRWHERAACTGMPLHVFFPAGDQSRTSLPVVRAKHVCDRCEVETECLAAAITLAEPDGIWGGLTPTERRALRRSQR